ncbi:hypothetical protein AAZV13_16G066400 [Glycine max]
MPNRLTAPILLERRKENDENNLLVALELKRRRRLLRRDTLGKERRVSVWHLKGLLKYGPAQTVVHFFLTYVCELMLEKKKVLEDGAFSTIGYEGGEDQGKL